MKFSFLLVILMISVFSEITAQEVPWRNGKLIVSEEGRYLKHENGKPFFWLGETGWLLPQRLNRDEVEFYLEECKKAGYNVVQIQVLNAVPSVNVYGQFSHIDGYNFDVLNNNTYGYWEHMDYIIKTAARKGIYIGMVCIWGGVVKAGHMNVEQAKAYGKFLAERYNKEPNIIWMIGGDIQGDVKREEWETLAHTIQALDKNHLMTFHPRGRTTSAVWFNEADWLNFNMFQSGHRRYGQRMGDKNYPIQDDTEEDNWRYVERSLATFPRKPVLDGEPIYEDIPHGLHDPNEIRWNEDDVRRYAYWSVFAGSCGHTYGHNSIMQFYRPGLSPAYAANVPWYDAVKSAGFQQMQYVKKLILAFPYFERIPDQSIIAGTNGEKYDRVIATRGEDYLLVYNYTSRPMDIDLRKISGKKKHCWWYNPRNGKLSYIGEFDSKIHTFQYSTDYRNGNDWILIAIDSDKKYISKEQKELSN